MTQKNDLALVPLARHHVAHMADIEKLCFGADAWSEETLYDELSQPLSRYFVCEQDGRPIGYIGTRLVFDECYITNVAVLPDFRRRGIANMLVAQLAQYAAEHSMTMLTLEVRQSNLGAQAFYAQAGFVVVGTRRGYYQNPKEDAILMTKTL